MKASQLAGQAEAGSPMYTVSFLSRNISDGSSFVREQVTYVDTLPIPNSGINSILVLSDFPLQLCHCHICKMESLQWPKLLARFYSHLDTVSNENNRATKEGTSRFYFCYNSVITLKK